MEEELLRKRRRADRRVENLDNEKDLGETEGRGKGPKGQGKRPERQGKGPEGRLRNLGGEIRRIMYNRSGGWSRDNEMENWYEGTDGDQEINLGHLRKKKTMSHPHGTSGIPSLTARTLPSVTVTVADLGVQTEERNRSGTPPALPEKGATSPLHGTAGIPSLTLPTLPSVTATDLGVKTEEVIGGTGTVGSDADGTQNSREASKEGGCAKKPAALPAKNPEVERRVSQRQVKVPDKFSPSGKHNRKEKEPKAKGKEKEPKEKDPNGEGKRKEKGK